MKTIRLIASVLAISSLSLFLFSSCDKESVEKLPDVDAGGAITVKLPLDSILLTATISNTSGIPLSYLWRKFSGPESLVFTTPDSISTYIKNFEAGTYVFQIMVKDNKGGVVEDTITVTINPIELDTLVLQPNHNQTEVHIWGNSTDKEQSFVDAVEIGADAWTHYGSPMAMRAALKFDLSDIPSSAHIVSAKLKLYSNPTPLNGVTDRANSGDDNTLLIQKITSSWDPLAVTWINQPPATDANEIVIPHTAEAFLDLDVDVSDFVSDMVTNETNYGFLIRLQTETAYKSRIFCSSKYTDETKHPKLEIVYAK